MANGITERILLNIVDRFPENLLLIDTNRLLEFVRDEFNVRDLRATALAELVARWCVSGDVELASQLSVLVGDAWRSFSDWFNVNRQWTGSRFHPDELPRWKKQVVFLGFREMLRRRLDRLFDADGFIPVFDKFKGNFIPFQLESSVDGAVWNDGTPIEAWDEPVRRALRGTGCRGIRVQLRPGPEVSVKGESLMLPVRMAALRGKPDGLPSYDVLRVLATGRFDDAFRLADVGLKSKIDAVKKQFRDAILFGPDVPGAASDDEKFFYRLESGLDECAVLQRIREALERTPGCVKMTRDYALRRLPDMMAHVDRENHHRWNEVAEQLELLKGALSERRDPETWLEFCSLLATALCHAGRTEDSKRCADEATAFAQNHGYLAKALRLKVTAAVNAQDLGEMEEFSELASGLEKELAEFNGPEKDDLLMRLHGTVAQANAYGAVYGVTGFSVEAAKAHVETAVGIAQKIADSAPEEMRDKAESDLDQDLNYRHLVFALFEPGTEVERSAFKDAQRQLNELSEKSRKNNLYFQLHQKTLALFNGWRRDGKKPAVAELSARLPLEAEGWLVAANRRHLGALAAAANDEDEAVKCFDEGEKALPLAKCWAPVLGSIRFALLVQAACSLAACDMHGESAKYVELAEQAYSHFGQSKLFSVIHAEKWIEALHASADPRTLPAFYY